MVVTVAAVLFLGLQFARKPIPNPSVTAEIAAPAEVRAILRTSCYDCHSNETQLKWFDKIVPVEWMVASDVREARRHLNFSELGTKPAAVQKATLFEAVNFIQMGAMPLPAYTAVHHGAVVTPEQLAVLRAYLETPDKTPAAPAAKPDTSAADAQYQHWLTATPVATVQPELNGVPFSADYKTWRVVSSSERWDNHTMREILGNPVAIKAIAEYKINPWPDGTIFAKVAWQQQKDANGVVHAGQFIQVELMIRDSVKYAKTAGWGWGRWRGTELKPYGANEHFANECVSCHMPVAKNDFVYSEPIKRQNGGQ